LRACLIDLQLCSKFILGEQQMPPVDAFDAFENELRRQVERHAARRGEAHVSTRRQQQEVAAGGGSRRWSPAPEARPVAHILKQFGLDGDLRV
jgi:hypothetical protein